MGLQAVLIVLLVIIAIGVMPLIFMLLWNWLVTDIFTLRIINYWEAFGLMVLFNLVFSNKNYSSKD